MVKEYGYEYNATINENIFSQVKWQSTDEALWGAYCLRSGRDALKVIAREYPNAVAYLPALCCDSMITPFEQYGCKIVFYPLIGNITVDFQTLIKLLAFSNEQGILLFYDYFGIPMFADSQLEELKSKFNNLIYVKDITHNLFSCKRLEQKVDYMVASLRKWTNIPDGGLLWTNCELHNSCFCDESNFAERRLLAQCLRTEYFETGEECIKDRYRRMFSEASSLLDDENPVKMTRYSFELANRTNWEEINVLRKRNAHVLCDLFSKCSAISLLNNKSENDNLYVPITIKSRDDKQSSLSKKGIFNTIIWPLRKEQKIACKTSRYICEHMLAVPCDQRYTEEDMYYIGTEIVRTINE